MPAARRPTTTCSRTAFSTFALRCRALSRRKTKEGEEMSSPYIGEIRMFGGTFAPAGWAMCQGQLMPISENDTLFNLIGTTYGGDGHETFGISDLQGRGPMHAGPGPGVLHNYQHFEQPQVQRATLKS